MAFSFMLYDMELHAVLHLDKCFMTFSFMLYDN